MKKSKFEALHVGRISDEGLHQMKGGSTICPDVFTFKTCATLYVLCTSCFHTCSGLNSYRSCDSGFSGKIVVAADDQH